MSKQNGLLFFLIALVLIGGFVAIVGTMLYWKGVEDGIYPTPDLSDYKAPSGFFLCNLFCAPTATAEPLPSKEAPKLKPKDDDHCKAGKGPVCGASEGTLLPVTGEDETVDPITVVAVIAGILCVIWLAKGMLFP